MGGGGWGRLSVARGAVAYRGRLAVTAASASQCRWLLGLPSAHHVFMVVFCDEPGRKARGEVIWGRGVDNAMNGVVVTNGYKTQTLADV
jgi:hypothetical protein